jgi:glycosyltransferase involved in cell wall biosynthesis
VRERLVGQGRPVIFIDHTTAAGGAELALPRVDEHSRNVLTFLFLESGAERLGFLESANIVVPHRALGLPSKVLFVRRYLRKHPEALVVTNTLRAGVITVLASPLHRAHLMYLRDGVDPGSLGFIKRQLLFRLVFPRLAALLPNSAWTASQVPHRFDRLLTQVVYSQSGMSSGNTLAGLAKPREHMPVELLSLSRIVEWKGIHIVLEALALISTELDAKALRLTIAGDTIFGPRGYLEKLLELAADLPFDVEFVGHQRDVRRLLEASDILVHASIRPEPFGQVVVQGLSLGLAVIATDEGGPSELIVDGVSGVLCEPGSATSLAAAIKSLVSNSLLRDRLGEGGVARAQSYTDHATVERFDSSIETAMQGRILGSRAHRLDARAG